jgi:MFS family permease
MFFFTSVGMFTVTPQTVVYLIDAGFDPVVSATAFGVTSMLSVGTLATIGFVAGRFGYRRTVTMSFVGSSVGLVILLALSWYPAAWLLVLYVLVFGACQGARGPIISAICTAKFAGPRLGTIYGTMYATNSIGAAIGSALGGLLHDATDGYVAVFAFALAALTCAALPMWVVRELREFR